MLYVPRKARTAFKKDFWASIVVGVMSGAIAPFLAFIASHRLHSSGTIISLIVAAPSMGAMLCVVWANAMEGKSRMRFATRAWIASRAVIILMVFATNRIVFAAVAMAYQFISMIAIPGYTAIMKAIYPDDHRGKLMGYVRVALTTTTMVTTLVAGPILRTWGWSYRIVFPIAALFGIASVHIFSSIEVPEDSDGSLDGVRRVSLTEAARSVASVLKRDKLFAWFIFSTTVYGFGNFLAMPVYTKFMDETLKMDEATLAIYSVLTAITLMLSYLYWGHYLDRRGPLRSTAVTIFVNAGIPLVFFLSPWFIALLPGVPFYVWALPAAVFNGIAGAGLDLSYFNAILHFAPPGQELDYQSVQYGVLGLRGIAGPIIGGVLYDVFRRCNYDVKYLFLVSLILVLAGWALLVFGGEKSRAEAQPVRG